MVPYRRDLGIIVLRVERVPILQLKPIRVVDESVAIRHVMHEQTPEEIPRDDGFGRLLRRFDDGVKLGECRRRGNVACPVVFAG